MKDDRENKLPKWAQDELAELRRGIEDRDRALAIAHRQAFQDGATGKIIADNLGSNGFPLNDRACIDFQLPGGKITAMLRENGTLLDLNGSSGILLQPRAANSAYVTLAQYPGGS